MNSFSPISAGARLDRLRGFIISFSELLGATRDEAAILESGGQLLRRLISQDDWLPAPCAAPAPDRYQQYLLHCDSRERFSVISFVWAPGQKTPVHDHQVWGLVGVLRGAERVERFSRGPDGQLLPSGGALLKAGEVDAVSPRIGDIHRVSNGLSDDVTVSIHIYGGNIGRVERSVYAEDGKARPFVSAYVNEALPNIWNG